MKHPFSSKNHPTSAAQTDTFASDTSGRTLREWCKALIILFIGLTIAHLGVTLFLLSELGTDTFTVFIQGLSRTVHLSVGTVHVIVLCILMIIMFFTTTGYIKPGTILCAFCGGPIIDFFTFLFQNYIHSGSPMLLRIFSMVLGCVILSLGMSIVINSNAGTGPNDLVAIILSDKLRGIQFRWVRVGCDFIFVLLGFLLHGTVGAGTLAAVCLTGPLVQFFLPKTKVPIQKFCSKPSV